jgi:hypothetical protein
MKISREDWEAVGWALTALTLIAMVLYAAMGVY